MCPHVPSHPTISLPVEVFSNLTDNRKLGEGGFGKVYQYNDSATRCSIAIKHIPTICKGLQDDASDVKKEVDVHSKIRHENIVHYIGFYQGSNSIYIMMEYMENGTLKDKLNMLKESDIVLDNKPAIACNEILRYTYHILCGLDYIHSKRIIHRDLRSPNILLSSQDVAKISDFGISKELLSTRSGFDTMHIGNVYWHAPELIDITNGKEKIGRRVDVWSLGITILEMVYILPPFMSLGREGEFPYMFKLCGRKELPDIPDFVTGDVKEILQKCLVFDADERLYSKDLLNLFIKKKETESRERFKEPTDVWDSISL